MATVKLTITLDAATASLLSDAAGRLGKPKSEVVREAIEDYHARIGRLSERERQRMLQAFDELVPQIPGRSRKEVDEEIRATRRARRGTNRLPGIDGEGPIGQQRKALRRGRSTLRPYPDEASPL